MKSIVVKKKSVKVLIENLLKRKPLKENSPVFHECPNVVSIRRNFYGEQ